MITLVTGASGHIGANLVRALLAEKRTVRVVVHEDVRALEGLPVEKVACDISNRSEVKRALKGISVVYHCAARIAISKKMEAGMLATNIGGTRNLVEGALREGVRRFIHFSSIHALSGKPDDEMIDETRMLVDHNSPMLYDISKAEGERIVCDGVGRGLDAVIINPTAVIGPFDFKPSLMGEFFLLVCERKLPVLVGGGFNWVDARDVAAGALSAEKKGRRGERYLLGGQWESVSGLSRIIEKITLKKTVQRSIPHWLAHIGVPFIALSAALAGKHPLYTHDSLQTLKHHRLVSSKKAQEALGFTARPLEETLRDMIAWFQEYGYLSA
jgi:dihydroflavonol-4-reductase